MIHKVVVLYLAFLLPTWVNAQVFSERAALNSLSKQKWERAKNRLKKAVRKDSLNTAAQFVMANYFFTPSNPDFQIDSAYRYAVKALENFQQSSPKQRDRLKRFPIDSVILVHYREKIDSAAFERAKSINTERAYLDFLRAFPLAIHRMRAEELRDETAYLDALKENTYQSFLHYLTKYPQAGRVVEARKRYEKLLYESKTHDKHLASYRTFLQDYPQTPYRQEVEKNIFEISTAAGDESSYLEFIQQNPESHRVRRAKDILYHMLRDEHRQPFPAMDESDSLKQIQLLEHQYLVPFLKDDLFGFMDEDGREVIKAQATEISKEYRCGNIIEDVIVLPDRILARNGVVIYTGEVSAVDDLEIGFLKIETASCVQVIHKSGFAVGDRCVQDAKLLNGRLLALKKNNLWSVWTLSGRLLQYYTWDDVSDFGDVVGFQKGKNIYLATINDVARIADQQLLSLKDSFDEVKGWSDKILWVKAGEYEGALNQLLNVHIKFEKHSLTTASFGAQSTDGLVHKVYNKKGEESPAFRKIQLQYPWVSVKVNGGWRLFDPQSMKYQSNSFDSIRFAGPCAIGISEDSLRIYFSPDNTLDVLKSARYEFIPGQDESFFLQLEQDNKKSLYNQESDKLFTIEGDKIQYAGQHIFIVSKKEKKGLVQADGKLILPVEYSAIGSVKDGIVSLLKSMKFGLYDIGQKKLIKPDYTKNLVPYNKRVIVAFKDGVYGFIGWDNKPISKFEFEEILYWNDSSALVRKNFQWMIYEIKSATVLLNNIKDFKLIQNEPTEKLAIIHQGNNYGVISSAKGTIIPPTFSDIVNVGSKEKPLYFTEKHVEEASIFVVIYYSAEGKLLRRDVFEQDDYDRIYCSGN